MSELSGAEGTENNLSDFNLDVDFSNNTGPDAGAGTGNPAWSTLKEKIPQEFHSQIDPILQQWDNGVKTQFQKLNEQVTPYKQFIEQGVSPQQLTAAYQFYNDVNQDPVGTYERLRDTLLQAGMIEEAAKAQQAADAAAAEEGQQTDPRIAEIERKQQELMERVQQHQQQQAFEQRVQSYEQQIAQERAAIEAKTGPWPEWLVEEVYNRAGQMTEQRGGQPVSLQEAFQSVQKLRQNFMNIPRPGTQAPRVVPSGGGFPAPQANPEALKTFDGRTAAIQDIVQRYSGN